MERVQFKRKDIKAGELRIRENQKGEVCYLTFPIFDAAKGFTHGFSTRLGGVSTGMFESMNLTSNRGDSRENVLRNNRILAEAAGYRADRTVCHKQTHTVNVKVITEENMEGCLFGKGNSEEVDGMITDVPDITLMAFFADCVPLFFIDPVKRVIGLSHSGWRGTVNKIGLKTVRLMRDTYGSDPDDILAAIGPSICRDCYEISEDVAESFCKAFPEEIRNKFLITNGEWRKLKGISVAETDRDQNEHKYRLDLWETNRQIMLEAGLRYENIEIPDICTCCNPKLLFSHRASEGKRGNLCGFLRIDP